MTTKDLQFFISDIETLEEFFLFGGRNRQTGEVSKFRINQWQNDLYAMVKFIEETKDLWYVGFNWFGFDAQVIEWILKHYESWHDLDNLQIAHLIAQYAQDVIDDGKYDIQPRFREEYLTIKQIDLYRVHHFDNENNRASLKWLEIMMDMPNVAEMPIHHTKRGMTAEDCQLVEDYWINDLDATGTFLDVTLGETELELYRGKNKLQDRLDAIAKYKFPRKCMNWSDVKIGEQINLMGYCTLKGIKPEDVYDMKKKRKPTRPFTFGQCIPPYVQFKTKEFQSFYDGMKKKRVSLHKKEEFPFSYRGTTYLIAKGGIHSKDPKRILIPGEDFFLRDADVGSQYPNAIVKRRLFPRHLGEEWLVNYNNTIKVRLEAKNASGVKALSEDEKRILKGMAEWLKLALNGGGFGMTNQVDSWQYDPFVQFSCTIGNQFEMLMLIEMMELSGIHCVSANTDGIVCMFPKDLSDRYYELCHEWEAIVGNTKMGMLEYTDYDQLIQESVNHYIAVKAGSKPKVKGRLAHEVPLNKNNTKDITRVQRMAIQEYFSKGIPVLKTLQDCKDIFKFIYGYKSRAYNFVATRKDGTEQDLGHLVRCYASTEGIKLSKSKEEDEGDGVDILRILQGSYITVYNQHIPKPIEDYKINYDFYAEGALQVIRQIEVAKYTGGRKAKKQPPPPPKEQMSMF